MASSSRSTPRNGIPRSRVRTSASAWWSARTASTIRMRILRDYVCGAERNYRGYCNPQLDELTDQQSREPDSDKRRQLVWEIERRLAEDNVRPVIFYARQATCRQPRVKGLTLMVNSIYNGSRFEDL